MQRISLGASSAPNVALGLMRVAQLDDDAIRGLVRSARDAGVDFFDHADIYGGEAHRSEQRFAEALQLTPSQRSEVTIQSKTGIVPGIAYDFSFEHIVSSVEGSLSALQTDYLDILLLHRPDALVEPEEVARAFDHLYDAGKVRAFGVSNHTPRQIDLLQRWVHQPIIANQLQVSLAHAAVIAQGIAANIQGEPQAMTVDGGGVLDYCRYHGITVQAWSPLQGPKGLVLDRAAYPELNAVIDRIAASYDVPPIAVAVAWLTRHPAKIQVVLGSTSPQRVADAAQGSELRITRAEWYELFRAAGYVLP